MRSITGWKGKTDDASIPPRVRLRIWDRDEGKCQGPCHRKLHPGDTVHYDHKVPLKDGGEHREENLQLLCEGCHIVKTGLEATARAHIDAIKKRHRGIKREPSIKVGRRFDGTRRRWTKEHGWRDVT